VRYTSACRFCRQPDHATLKEGNKNSTGDHAYGWRRSEPRVVILMRSFSVTTWSKPWRSHGLRPGRTDFNRNCVFQKAFFNPTQVSSQWTLKISHIFRTRILTCLGPCNASQWSFRINLNCWLNTTVRQKNGIFQGMEIKFYCIQLSSIKYWMSNN
jgi:hypothetical protein